MTPHGLPWTYTNHSCRCDECRDEWRLYNAELRRVRSRRLKREPNAAPHGSRSTYLNWLCRCDRCTEASRAYGRSYQRRKAQAS